MPQLHDVQTQKSPSQGRFRVGVDIGGTFTDIVLHDLHSARLRSHKVPSTPNDPAEAVLAGLESLFDEAGVSTRDIAAILHATTVATNTVLERKGAETGLITTEGFRDVLIIGRQKRYETYNLYLNKPAPLVQRRHIVEVAERMDHDGSVVTELNMESVDRAIDALIAAGRETVAVSLMHAYANGTHETAIRDRISRRAPDLEVSLSSEISPKFREYERTSTTVANAYIKPIVARYISRLETALAARGLDARLFVMQSSGGLISPDIACDYPIRIIESGPAAGVLMAGIVGAGEDADHVITFDMGGTTAKLGAVDAGVPAIAPAFEIGHVNYRKGSGLPVTVPAVELLEIGAGGGSIARVEMGMIAVGPESAGAAPGPICFGRGGDRVTVTDANVVLGYIAPDRFNAGRMKLDPEAARKGIEDLIAKPLGLDPGAAAWGIHLVATSNMENAMRVISVERGRDPRLHAMVAFGGAGPLHAARLARSIGIPRVIVPQGAGVGSALGLLDADPRIDVSMTRVLRLDEADDGAIADIYRALEVRAGEILRRLDPAATPVWSRYATMRYAGQGFEIHVDLPDGPIDETYRQAAARAFDAAYLRLRRFLDPDAAVEAVDWTLVATLPGNPHDADATFEDEPVAVPGQSVRQAWFPEAGGYTEARVLSRGDVRSLGSVAGPAIIEDPDCTTLLPPGDTARIGGSGHLIIDVAGG